LGHTAFQHNYRITTQEFTLSTVQLLARRTLRWKEFRNYLN